MGFRKELWFGNNPQWSSCPGLITFYISGEIVEAAVEYTGCFKTNHIEFLPGHFKILPRERVGAECHHLVAGIGNRMGREGIVVG